MQRIMTTEKWQYIMCEKSNKTAPGEDQISYQIFKSLKEEVVSKIIYEINIMYYRCKIPPKLKIVKLIPIMKPGKDNSLSSSYRLISIQQTIFLSTE